MNCQSAIWPDAHHTLITTTQSCLVFTRVKYTGMEAEHEQYHVGWHCAALRPIYAHWLLNQVTWTIPWHGNIYMHAWKLEHLQQECWIVKKQIKLICNNLSYVRTHAHTCTHTHTHSHTHRHPSTPLPFHSSPKHNSASRRLLTCPSLGQYAGFYMQQIMYAKASHNMNMLYPPKPQEDSLRHRCTLDSATLHESLVHSMAPAVTFTPSA